MFLGAPLALFDETVEHGDVCPLDAPPSALTACETDLHGDVSIDFDDLVCISGHVVLLVALPISFALGPVSKVFGFWGFCRTAVLLLSFGSALSLSIWMLRRCPICFQFLLAALICCCFCSRVVLLHPPEGFRPARSRVLHVLQCIFSGWTKDKKSQGNRVHWVLFGAWLDGFPFPGLWLWLSCSSVLHELPAGRKLYSSRMRSVLEARHTGDYGSSNWFGTPGGHDVLASAYTMLLYAIEVGSIAIRKMALVAGMISCMFWDFRSLFRWSSSGTGTFGSLAGTGNTTGGRGQGPHQALSRS